MNQPIYEVELHYFWQSIKKSKKLTLTDGRELIIITPGIWNKESGPDFKNAKILIDNEVIIGDIEIHKESSAWYAHMHHNNSEYDNVVLHIITKLDSKCPDLPTLLLDYKKINKNSNLLKYNCGKCIRFYQALNNEEIMRIFEDAGEERFHLHCTQYLTEIIKFGLEYTIEKHLFIAMGYKNNKKQFEELYNLYTSFPGEDKIPNIDAIIWALSGLLPNIIDNETPDNMKQYIMSIYDSWSHICDKKYPEINWRFNSIRPANHPTRRVAGIINLLKNNWTKNIIKLFNDIDHMSPKDFNEVLLNSLLIKDQLWEKHYTFTKTSSKELSLIGHNRSIEILTNVIYPIFYANCLLKNYENKKIIDNWKLLPASTTNSLIDIATKMWLFPSERKKKIMKSAAIQQGIIHIYKVYCEANQCDCNSCKIFNSL
jgi:hypothetical protein